MVALPRKARRGDSFLLEVEAEGDIVVRPSGDSYWRLGGEPWYPKPGVGGQEWAEIRITAKVRSPFLPFAGGEVVDSWTGDGASQVRTRLDAPMEYAMVVAGNYRTVTEEHDGARVHISSYASVKEEAARRVAQVILSVQECLESWLDVAYPFEDLQVIEVKQWGWGQAPPGLIFITQEAFLTRASARVDEVTESGAAVFSRGINEGDDMFFSWIRSYVKNFTFKVGATPHLITMLHQITGEDWQAFFERYIYGVETPTID